MLAERSYRLLSLLMLEGVIVSKFPQSCLIFGEMWESVELLYK